MATQRAQNDMPLARRDPEYRRKIEIGHQIWRRITAAGLKIIYSREGSAVIVDKLKQGAQDPVRAVAEAAIMVLQRVMPDIKGIDPRLAVASIPAWIMVIYEIAARAGIFVGNPKMAAQSLQVVRELIGSVLGPQSQRPQAPGAGLVSGAMPQAAVGGMTQAPVAGAMPQTPTQMTPTGG